VIAGRIDPQRTRELRRSVLRPLLGPADALPGDDRPDAIHFGAWDEDGTVLSACLVAPQPCPWRPDLAPAWVLRQMATDPERRGTGAGSAVLDAVLTDLDDGLLWCLAREPAIEFYRRHGFRSEGEAFLDEELQLPHLRMWRPIREQ
jgi:predicted GNAT family N-acyltransferase